MALEQMAGFDRSMWQDFSNRQPPAANYVVFVMINGNECGRPGFYET